MDAMASMTLRLDDELYQRVRLEAFRRRESITQVIRHALYAWLTEQPPPTGERLMWQNKYGMLDGN